MLGYWDMVLDAEPAELQVWIDEKAAGIQVPCHFVHLVDPGRFATRLQTFVEHCDHAS